MLILPQGKAPNVHNMLFSFPETALLLVSTKNRDLQDQPLEGPTLEVRDSRTSRHFAHAQSQVWQIWLAEKTKRLLCQCSKHRHARRARVIFLCVWSLGDRSIHGAVYSNDLVNLTSFFGCGVQQERNWEFTMYIRCYIGNGKIAK